MKQYSREKLLEMLHAKVANGTPIIVGGAGYGLMAKIEDRAGIDIIMAYNTGPYRMDGHVSLTGYRPYGDSNADTIRIGKTAFNVVEKTPVIAGIGPNDPFRDMDKLIDEMMYLGFSGITNVPSSAENEHQSLFKNVVDAYGMGEAADLNLIRRCRNKNVFTLFYAFSKESLRKQIAEGIDMVSVHVGGTTGGTTGVPKDLARSIDECCQMTQEYYDIAMEENPDVIIVTHGGPFENPESLKYCFERVQIHGFIGASSIERLPVERELLKVLTEFKNLKLR